ncbi:MAG: 4Fe-4S dicluster domain-containing protein [Candidatus Methanomethylicaceae archaeon]|jgi:energy-converting hydrogenase B subunit L
MIAFIRLMIEGAYKNFVRVAARRDRITSIEIRESVASQSVPMQETVLDETCIGCSGCFHVCPTQAITMVQLEKPVEIIEGYSRTQVPRIDFLKCIYCLNCHDICPIYSVFGEAAPIHARDVGAPRLTLQEILKKPVRAPPDKILELSKLIPAESIALISRRENN